MPIAHGVDVPQGATIHIEFQSPPHCAKQLQMQVGWTVSQMLDAARDLNGWSRENVVVVAYFDGNEVRASDQKLSQIGITSGSTVYIKKDWAKCACPV